MKKVELLAPAGSMESIYAAVNNGADAIYLGGPKFSARAKAVEFDNETMKEAVDYCHSYGVEVYVTMNTILKESELKEAIRYVGYLYEIGVNALIVQDTGLVELIQEKYPDFEIHASTQMTIHNGEGALYYRDKGFTRVVLSRELSLKEIEYISKDLGLETEIFVHGALCVSYSGQCLMSAMIGSRSGNRGKCAQPCRQEYRLVSKNSGEKKGHLLSTKDTCTIDDIKDIIKSGAYSLKVEGRMKRPEYVAGVIETYRNALDNELENKKFDKEEGKKTLLQLFNRGGFANAYLKKDSGKDMMSFSIPRNTGIEVGKVDEKGRVKLFDTVGIGDGIGCGNKGFTLSKIIHNGREVREADKGDIVELFPKMYKKGEVIYRTSSKSLSDRLQEKIKPYYRKISLKGQVRFKLGEPISLKAEFNNKTYEVFGDLVERAERKPLDKERIVESLEKSGGYPYKFEEIDFVDFEDGFLRVSSLNNLRRELFDKILKDVLSKDRRKRPKLSEEKAIENNYKEPLNLGLLVTCVTKEQLDTLVKMGIKNIGVDLYSREKNALKIKDIENLDNVNLYILTPEIIKGEFDSVVSMIEKSKNYIKGIITSNAGIINIYKDKMQIIGDYKLNVFNSKALDFYRRDLNTVSLSLELNKREIKEILKKAPSGIAYQIYGKTELMVSEYCPIGSTFGGKNKDKSCNLACTRDSFTLVDEKNEGFRVMTDVFCRSHILNGVALNLIGEKEELKSMGVKTFRVDFKDESSQDIMRIFDMIEGKSDIENKYYTKGCYRRGVE
ncbi:MAG: U32 family peptidase [Clostridiaceae bacterium]|nr:U32 family peptidase [Clostridiaceae bacterium]